MIDLDRNTLRKTIRAKRNQLTEEEQQQQEHSIAQQLISYCCQQGVSNIAIYLANDGELRTQQFIQLCWQSNISVYLPVIHPFSSKHLIFLNYDKSTSMRQNKFGIWEPKLNSTRLILPEQLDVLFTPLVAFDIQGNRMGMGGGFYDRTLVHLKNKSTKIVGLAHNCQQVPQIPTQPWDMPLDEIITPGQHIIPIEKMVCSLSEK